MKTKKKVKKPVDTTSISGGAQNKPELDNKKTKIGNENYGKF